MEPHSQVDNSLESKEVLEGQLRESFGRVVYSHKTHEKCSDILVKRLLRIKLYQIILSAMVTSSFVFRLFGLGEASFIFGALFSAGLLCLTLYAKDYNLGELAQKHKQTAIDIWLIRERYQSLITDLVMEGKSLEVMQQERDIEDAAMGGYEGKKKLLNRQKPRAVNPQDFENARKAAEKSGYEGEELLNELFDSEVNFSQIKNYRWVSKENAISPYDFILDEGESTCCKVDAKTTIGPFGNKIHVSTGELYEMANPKTQYRIYRIYELKPDSAKFRISGKLREFAESTIEKIEQLQDGITVDSFSIDPNLLDFEPEQAINLKLRKP